MNDTELTKRIRSRIDELGGDAEVAGVLLKAARAAKLPLADACGLIEVESGFRGEVIASIAVLNAVQSSVVPSPTAPKPRTSKTWPSRLLQPTPVLSHKERS